MRRRWRRWSSSSTDFQMSTNLAVAALLLVTVAGAVLLAGYHWMPDSAAEQSLVALLAEKTADDHRGSRTVYSG